MGSELERLAATSYRTRNGNDGTPTPLDKAYVKAILSAMQPTEAQVEAVARAISGAPFPSKASMNKARASITAFLDSFSGGKDG